MGEALSTKVRSAERPRKTFLANSAAINNEICEFANSHFLGLKHKAHSLRHYTPSHPSFATLLTHIAQFGRGHIAGGNERSTGDVPQAMGYAKIAGTPVITGLYTLLLPLVAFAAFWDRRATLWWRLIQPLRRFWRGGLSGLAMAGSAQYVSLAGLVALLTAGFLLLARLLKLGFLADFLSRTVLIGFLTGVGFQVGIAVLSDMLKLEVHGTNPVKQLL